MYAILRSRKKFEALRTFTLESGQEQIEQQNQRRKERGDRASGLPSPSRAGSSDSVRSPTGVRHPRTAALSNVPEDTGAFAIGDDDDSDNEAAGERTPSQSSPSAQNSRRPSISSVDDTVPLQLRGMSEKARGKRPAGAPSFSRQNSMTSLSSPTVATMPPGFGFAPSAQWVGSTALFRPRPTILTKCPDRDLAAAASPPHHPHPHPGALSPPQRLFRFRHVSIDPPDHPLR